MEQENASKMRVQNALAKLVSGTSTGRKPIPAICVTVFDGVANLDRSTRTEQAERMATGFFRINDEAGCPPAQALYDGLNRHGEEPSGAWYI